MCRVIDAEATGKRLKLLCDKSALTIDELQFALGLADSRSIYYWFSGRYLPSLDNMYLISQLLRVKIDDIIVPLNSG